MDVFLYRPHGTTGDEAVPTRARPSASTLAPCFTLCFDKLSQWRENNSIQNKHMKSYVEEL